jgi:deoxycytidylate deaminase
LLSVGFNSYVKSHPLQKKYAEMVGHSPLRDKLHAEIQAIIRAKGKEIYKIVIERYNKNGNPVNAMPCPICQLAIKEAEIKRVEYTI